MLGKSSRRLLAYAVQRKWVAATRTLLATVAADQPAAEAMAAVSVAPACNFSLFGRLQGCCERA